MSTFTTHRCARGSQRFTMSLATSMLISDRTIPVLPMHMELGGCTLESADQLPAGEPVSIAFVLQTDGRPENSLPPIMVSGTVRWSAANYDDAPDGQRFVASIRFEAPDPGSINMLRGFIQPEERC